NVGYISCDEVLTTWEGETGYHELGGIEQFICTDFDDRIYLRDDSSETNFDQAVTVHGLAGDDFILGGDGNDNLYGDAGNDTILGGGGDDLIGGGEDNDALLGGDGNDTINTDDGADSANGGAGDDLIFVKGDGSVDTIDGGAGYDWAAPAEDELDLLTNIEVFG